MWTWTSNEQTDQNNLLVWAYTSHNNSLCPSVIIVTELVMHDIELMCTCDYLNTKVQLTFCWQLMICFGYSGKYTALDGRISK